LSCNRSITSRSPRCNEKVNINGKFTLMKGATHLLDIKAELFDFSRLLLNSLSIILDEMFLIFDGMFKLFELNLNSRRATTFFRDVICTFYLYLEFQSNVGWFPCDIKIIIEVLLKKKKDQHASHFSISK
jgi:hypothetical protein